MREEIGEYCIVGSMELPCNKQVYGESVCPKCGGKAYIHAFDACHYPRIISYSGHCHSCGVLFNKTKEYEEEVEYVNKARKEYLEKEREGDGE